MPSPIFLAAASFFTVIVVGTLLVAINDWLEGRSADPQPAVGIGPRPSVRPVFERRQRTAIRRGARTNRLEPQSAGRDVIVDWF